MGEGVWLHQNRRDPEGRPQGWTPGVDPGGEPRGWTPGVDPWGWTPGGGPRGLDPGGWTPGAGPRGLDPWGWTPGVDPSDGPQGWTPKWILSQRWIVEGMNPRAQLAQLTLHGLRDFNTLWLRKTSQNSGKKL